MIPLSKPMIDENDIKAVVDVIRSGWLVHGPKNEEFEKMLADYIGTKYAISMNSCASALHVSLLINGVGPGDEVIIPSFTHTATANCVLTNGATPVFADVDLDTFNVDLADMESRITERTKVMMPVHFAGSSCDMDRVMSIVKKSGAVLVEDAAEACGAEYKGRKAGSFGIGCFSFFPIKNFTTGEGGALTLNDEKLYEEAYAIIGHGMDKSAWARSYAKYPWHRVQRTIGYNFRLTNFQAALGIEQLKKLEQMNDARRKLASEFTAFLKQFGFLRPQRILDGCKSSYQMYTVRVLEGVSRDDFLNRLRENGIGASAHFDPPVHLQPYYVKLFGKISLPNTERLSKSICTLPMYPTMTEEEKQEMFQAIEKTVRQMGL